MIEKMTYAGVGVNYDAMDTFKRMAQAAAREASVHSETFRRGFHILKWTRGESVQIYDTSSDFYLGHVEEGVGTKNLVADAMYRLTGKSYYDHIAQDTVAMVVNDMITLGALPLSVAMHLAVGDSNWFNDAQRCRDLVEGWRDACNLARCVWGGGETSTLKGVVAPEAVALSGSAMGIVKPKERLINPDNIQHGDAIVFIESSGIHANGLTMARKIAEKLSDGYLTPLDDGRTYGETLLDATHIYVGFVEDCLNRGVNIHYSVNVTGHGWRKLMRATQLFTYVIERLPRQLPIFDFIQKMGQVEDSEMYSTFNMGAGFALYVPEADVQKVWNVLGRESKPPYLFGAIYAGHIERSNEKKVVIKPKNLEYSGTTLGVR